MLISSSKEINLDRGTSGKFWLGVGHSWCGPIQIPLFVARGQQPGPKLVIIACQHGDEGFSVLGCLDLMASIHPEQLTGDLFVIPCINVPGYIAGKRSSPFDGQDMNRVHPGRSDGTITEQIADVVHREVVSGADLLLDLHGGSAEVGDISFGRWVDVEDKSSIFPLVQRLDLDFVLAPGTRDIPGMLSRYTPELGVPQISIEAGAPVFYARENSWQIQGFCQTTMSWLGMLATAPPKAKDHPVMTTVSMPASTGGVFKTLVSMGENVPKGKRLGYVTDLLGNVVQELEAPEDGKIAVMRLGVRVHPGESLITMAVPSKDEI